MCSERGLAGRPVEVEGEGEEAGWGRGGERMGYGG